MGSESNESSITNESASKREPTSKKESTNISNEITKLDSKTQKNAIFDKNTKKFLRWE